MVMRVVVVGAGSTGRELARRLAVRHDVTLVDPDDDALRTCTCSLEAAPTARPVAVVRGDGTSRLQLSKLHDPSRPCALVAVGATDEVNLEVARLGRELHYDPVLALRRDPPSPGEEPLPGVVTVERTHLIADHAERALAHRGAIVPTGIGLGRGELVEIRILATSPILGRPLKDMAPDRWRVAAVFRDDELIVPTGDTTLEVDDRVLLVGDPTVLRGVAEHIRLGTPQFPLPFGVNVVSLERESGDEALCREARGLAEACAPALWARGLPGRERSSPPEAAGGQPDESGMTRTFRFGAIGDDDLLRAVAKEHPGVVLTRRLERSLLARVAGSRGADARLCDSLEAPILFTRGSFPYKRILLPVSDSQLALAAAEVAIDLTRLFSAKLTAVNVDLPQYISGHKDEDLHDEVVPIRRLCQLYEITLDYRHHLGNPVRLILQEAAASDLVVVARHRGRSDTFFNPDVALRVARGAPCSALVLTVGHLR
jgi:uncharacterized protein